MPCARRGHNAQWQAIVRKKENRRALWIYTTQKRQHCVTSSDRMSMACPGVPRSKIRGVRGGRSWVQGSW